VLLFALLATLAVVISQARSIAREAQRAQSTRDFLLRVFSAAEPAGPRLAPPTVADVVRTSIDEAQHAASLAPQVRVKLVDALGGVLRKQGDLKGSLELLERNYRDALAALGGDDPAVLQAGLGLAQARSENGLHAAARTLLDTLMAHAGSGVGVDLRARLLVASANLGTERFERERAFAESERAVALCRDDCSERTRIQTLQTRGYVLSNFQDDAAAIPVLEQALAEQERLFGPAHVEVAITLQALSRAYRRLGQLDRAQSLARRSIGIVEASLPDPHQRRADALDTLRHVLIDARQLDEAVALGQRIIAIDEVARGPGHPALATDQNTLGFTYMLQQDYVRAGEHFRAALAIADALGDERRSAIYQADLGYALGLGGDAAAGMPKLQAAIARFRAQKEVDYSEVTSALEKLGDLQRRGGALAAAQATYAEADRLYRERLPGAPGEWHARTLVGLGRVLAASGDHAGARRTLGDALARFATPESRLSMLRIEARAALADLLARNGAADEALRLLELARGEAARTHGYLPDDVRDLLRSAGAAVAPRG
jgi:serine/threonine-protein kinase